MELISDYMRDEQSRHMLNALTQKTFGFDFVNQYRYFVKEEFCNSKKAGEPFKPVSEMGEDIKEKYKELVRNSYPHSAFEQMNKFGLQMFYTSGMDTVYYSSDLDCFIVKEQDCDTVITSVLCRKKVGLAEVLKRIDVENRVRLGFVPLDEDKELCECSVYDGADDYRLFYRGAELAAIERDRLYFPDLSHAYNDSLWGRIIWRTRKHAA